VHGWSCWIVVLIFVNVSGGWRVFQVHACASPNLNAPLLDIPESDPGWTMVHGVLYDPGPSKVKNFLNVLDFLTLGQIDQTSAQPTRPRQNLPADTALTRISCKKSPPTWQVALFPPAAYTQPPTHVILLSRSTNSTIQLPNPMQ
jgi:hypothetical protein